MIKTCYFVQTKLSPGLYTLISYNVQNAFIIKYNIMRKCLSRKKYFNTIKGYSPLGFGYFIKHDYYLPGCIALNSLNWK